MTVATLASPGTSIGVPQRLARGVAILTFSVGTIAGPATPPTPEQWTTAQPSSASSASRATAAGNLASSVRRLRERSGLSWAQLAEAFGVSRRAMHFWANGGNMTGANVERLGLISAQLDELGPISAESTRMAVLIGTPDNEPLMKQWQLLSERSRIRDQLPLDAALGGAEETSPQRSYGRPRSGGRVPVELKDR